MNLEVLAQINQILADFPLSKSILEDVRDGKCSLEQASKQLEEVLSPEDTQLILNTRRTIENRLHVYDSSGKPASNPLFNSALIERSFLDGDVPEFRVGPLPEGSMPAVPVVTDALNPVVVGMMLDRASRKVLVDMEEAQKQLTADWIQKTQDKFLAAPEGTDLTSIVLDPIPILTGLPEVYEAGCFPAPLDNVPEPTMLELINQTPTQAQTYAYKALATTQGRRTLCPTVEKHLARKLGVSPGKVSKAVAQAHWTMTMIGGPKDVSRDFSPADTAIAVLAAELINKAGPSHFDTVEVSPVGDVSARVFGWSAKVGLSQ